MARLPAFGDASTVPGARTRRSLHRITDLIPQAIVVLAPDGSMLHANAFVLEYSGLRLEDIKAED